MISIAKALNKLGITEWILRGEPTNETEFNLMFHKVIEVDANGSAIESNNPNDFGVTWEQVLEKQNELKNAEPMRLLREERNHKLAETDWKDLPSYPGTDQEEWRTYRQSLRDLPLTSSPKLDENGRLSNVTWPTKPE